MNDRLHKSIYGQTLDEMKEDKGAWEYICDTCKHNDKKWDEEPCDGCCGNHSGYEPSGDLISRQAVQDYIAKYLSQYLYDDVREAVEVIDEYIGELPSVNPQEPILDKIRAEIEKPLREEIFFDTDNAKAQAIALNWCIEIIDKYKKEDK